MIEPGHDGPETDLVPVGEVVGGVDSHDPTGLFVLVVEDHEDTAHTTAALLRCYGHEVRIAFDGPTALRIAQEWQPDVVLLDIGLPGIDGYDLARLLHQRSPYQRRPLLIAITGLGQEEDRRRSNEAGMDLHLVKPIEPDQLRAVLRRFQRLLSEPSRRPG